MSGKTTEGESPHDSDEQHYDSDAAAAIARSRIAEDLDPSEFGAARTLDELLLTFAEEVRSGDVTAARVSDVRTHLRNLDDALDDLAALHGFGDDRPADGTPDAVAEILAPLEVSRDELGSTRIDVSETATAYVYDEGDPDEVELDLRALDADAGRDGVASLTPGDAYRLRQALDETLTAREAERRRYDREYDTGE